MAKRALVAAVNDYSTWNGGVTIGSLTLTAPNLHWCLADANDFSRGGGREGEGSGEASGARSARQEQARRNAGEREGEGAGAEHQRDSTTSGPPARAREDRRRPPPRRRREGRIYDPAPRHPLFQALSVRLPHVHTGPWIALRWKLLNCFSKNSSSVLLPFPPNHNGSPVSRLLTTVRNSVSSPDESRQCPSAARPASFVPPPALQIPQIDGAHGAGRQPKLLRHPPHRCTLASQPYRLFEALAERRLAGQLRYLLCFDAAVRAAHPIQLNYHRRPILRPGQIAHLPLIDVAGFGQLPPAAGTHQLPVAPLASHPQLRVLRA